MEGKYVFLSLSFLDGMEEYYLLFQAIKESRVASKEEFSEISSGVKVEALLESLENKPKPPKNVKREKKKRKPVGADTAYCFNVCIFFIYVNCTCQLCI